MGKGTELGPCPGCRSSEFWHFAKGPMWCHPVLLVCTKISVSNQRRLPYEHAGNRGGHKRSVNFLYYFQQQLNIYQVTQLKHDPKLRGEQKHGSPFKNSCRTCFHFIFIGRVVWQHVPNVYGRKGVSGCKVVRILHMLVKKQNETSLC